MSSSRARKGTKHTKNRKPSNPKKPLPKGTSSSPRGDIPLSDPHAIAVLVGDSLNDVDALRPNASPPSAMRGAIQWPSHWNLTEGWPSENDSKPAGETLGELAARAGTTVEAVSRKLGKPGR